MPDLSELARELAAAPRAIVLVDGGSGAGKTTFAAELASVWPGPVRVVPLDAFYPGWDGLAAASMMVARDVLGRHGYRRWDWALGRPTEWVSLDPVVPMIIEGCGALTPANRALATAGIWLAMDADRRRERALARDGEMFAPHWERWEAQERAHWRRHHPRELADWVIEGGRLRRRSE